MTATKYDAGKPDMTLLPKGPLEDVVRVLEFGAKKYGRDNWRQGMDINRVLSAAIRHIFAHVEQVPLDDESGLPHIAHAACNLLFALQYLKYIDNPEKPQDNTSYGRPTGVCEFRPAVRTVSEIEAAESK